MENIIYFLKQKEHNRVKIGSTTNIQKRVEKLEKDWGKFDDNSELHYFNIDELMKNCLSLDNIEKTIQRIMKLKNQYLDFSIDHEEKDGKTEFFRHDIFVLNETIGIFRDSILKTDFIRNIKNRNDSHEVIVLQKYYDIKKQNEIRLKLKNLSIVPLIEKNNDVNNNDVGSLKEIISNNIRSIKKMKTLIDDNFIGYSTFNNYNEGKFLISIRIKNIDFGISNSGLVYKTFIDDYCSSIKEFAKFETKRRIDSTMIRGFKVSLPDKNNIQTVSFSFYYSSYKGVKFNYIKYIIRQIIDTLAKKNIKRIKYNDFKQTHKIPRARKNSIQKMYDSKNIFNIFFQRNKKKGVYEF